VYDGSVSKDCLMMTIKAPISHLADEKQRHEALESNGGGDLDGKVFVIWRIEEFQNFDYVVDPAPIVGILDLTGTVYFFSKNFFFIRLVVLLLLVIHSFGCSFRSC
jgi:hypothetical protein